jgi:hypothetical protein
MELPSIGRLTEQFPAGILPTADEQETSTL